MSEVGWGYWVIEPFLYNRYFALLPPCASLRLKWLSPQSTLSSCIDRFYRQRAPYSDSGIDCHNITSSGHPVWRCSETPPINRIRPPANSGVFCRACYDYLGRGHPSFVPITACVFVAVRRISTASSPSSDPVGYRIRDCGCRKLVGDGGSCP